MNRFLLLLLGFMVLAIHPVWAGPSGPCGDDEKKCRALGMKDAASRRCNNDDGACSPEMRGRCGKRRGDWYGASQPVGTPAEARALLTNYFAGQSYTLSEITEKKWGFKADLLDKDGKVIDRVMIDKRSGRIRSLY